MLAQDLPPPPPSSRLSPYVGEGRQTDNAANKLAVFLFFVCVSDGRQVYLHVPLSIIPNLITHVCVSLSLPL